NQQQRRSSVDLLRSLNNEIGAGVSRSWIHRNRSRCDHFRRFFDQQTLRSEEHTSELQSRFDLVCRLLLEKKKKKLNNMIKSTKRKPSSKPISKSNTHLQNLKSHILLIYTLRSLKKRIINLLSTRIQKTSS